MQTGVCTHVFLVACSKVRVKIGFVRVACACECTGACGWHVRSPCMDVCGARYVQVYLVQQLGLRFAVRNVTENAFIACPSHKQQEESKSCKPASDPIHFRREQRAQMAVGRRRKGGSPAGSQSFWGFGVHKKKPTKLLIINNSVVFLVKLQQQKKQGREAGCAAVALLLFSCFNKLH